MNATLWVIQVLLALVFLGSGTAKATMSKPRMLATGQTGVAPFPLPVIRFTAVCELLAAVGLILPRLTGVLPGLTPAAAIGLCVVMVAAATVHWRLGEPRNVGVNVVLLLLCLVVVAGRIG